MVTKGESFDIKKGKDNMKKLMHSSIFAVTVIICFLFLSCTAVQIAKKTEKTEQMYVNATLQSISEHGVVALLLHLPEFNKSRDPFIGEIARQVIEKSMAHKLLSL